MARHRDFSEILDLINEAKKIAADDFIEPDTPLEPGQKVLGTVKHYDLKRLYTLMIRRINRLNELQNQIAQAGGTNYVPDAVLEEGIQKATDLELVREMFFATLFKRFATPNIDGLGIAEGWQVFWQNPHLQQQAGIPPSMVMIDPNAFDDGDKN